MVKTGLTLTNNNFYLDARMNESFEESKLNEIDDKTLPVSF
jgi:hypothetical protein